MRGAADRVRPVDQYTLGHGMIGFLLGMWGVPWYGALASSVVWELIENLALKRIVPRIFPVAKADPAVNSILDVGAWMLGYGLAKAALPPDPAPIWKPRA